MTTKIVSTLLLLLILALLPLWIVPLWLGTIIYIPFSSKPLRTRLLKLALYLPFGILICTYKAIKLSISALHIIWSPSKDGLFQQALQAIGEARNFKNTNIAVVPTDAGPNLDADFDADDIDFDSFEDEAPLNEPAR